LEWTEAEPGRTEIGPNEIHIWRFPLPADPASAATVHLSADELARVRAMESASARGSFVASQTALRQVLAGYTGTPPGSLAFVRGRNGKPQLMPEAAGIRFNVSHSGRWGLIAVAESDVGVDVEAIRPRRASARLAERFLTEGERQLIRQREGSHSRAAFFMIWSRKEAYLKATGLGLAAPFGTVDSSGARLPDLDEHGNPRDSGTPWAISEFFVDEEHPAAVVARAQEVSLCFLTLRRSSP